MTLGSVPLAPYATTGSAELSEVLKPFIPDYNAILMANHGVVSYGSDLSQAYLRMEAVEHFAKIVLTARQLGCGTPLDRHEVQRLTELRRTYTRVSR